MPAYIRLNKVSLSVPIYLQKERQAGSWIKTILSAALDPPRREWTELLHEIDLEFEEGDRVAILGRNGAGKSTLLRVLNGVFVPTSGSIEVSGSRQALLNISLGFNNEATVRENILLRGTAMGMQSSLLHERMDEILEFAGLKEKANHRLRTLSAGQRVRIGFSISTAFQNDIILMDEWMGTGDAEFLRKATERMQGRVSGSKIVVLASHSIPTLQRVCNKGIVLERGRLVHSGDIASALKCYHELMAQLREGRLQEFLGELAAEDRETSTVYGFVESVEWQNGMLVLSGWSVDSEGAVPKFLEVEVQGRRHRAGRLDVVRRPDVMRHVGLASDGCGFLAFLELPGIQSLAGLEGDLKPFAGIRSEAVDHPLRLSAKAATQVVVETTVP